MKLRTTLGAVTVAGALTLGAAAPALAAEPADPPTRAGRGGPPPAARPAGRQPPRQPRDPPPRGRHPAGHTAQGHPRLAAELPQERLDRARGQAGPGPGPGGHAPGASRRPLRPGRRAQLTGVLEEMLWPSAKASPPARLRSRRARLELLGSAPRARSAPCAGARSARLDRLARPVLLLVGVDVEVVEVVLVDDAAADPEREQVAGLERLADHRDRPSPA